ncbi:MAG TPA: hypothetical protein VKW78_07630 [Terriglobales bacterium]|nr:hypothetical protein [Terriglobales bacterium]
MHISWLWTSQYHIAILGTIFAFVAAWLSVTLGGKSIDALHTSDQNRFRLRQALNTFVLVGFVITVSSSGRANFSIQAPFLD